MSETAKLRLQLLELLKGGHAHATFSQVVNDFPVKYIGVRRPGFSHSAWELLEHLRLAQADILNFSRSANYVEPKWPDDYWPATPAPDKPTRWKDSIAAFRTDLDAFEQLIKDPTRDLYQPFPWGKGQTLLREALLLADHNAWHLGQLMLLRRALEHARS